MLAPVYRSYIQIRKLHISEVTHFSFFTLRVYQHCRQCKVSVGLVSFQNRKKKRSGKLQQAPDLPRWSVCVTAWSAISSSPTEAASCAAGRQLEQPPAPHTTAAGAGGLCSTWPLPGMTSTGRGKWTGRGGAGLRPSHRLGTEEKSLVGCSKRAFQQSCSKMCFSCSWPLKDCISPRFSGRFGVIVCLQRSITCASLLSVLNT